MFMAMSNEVKRKDFSPLLFGTRPESEFSEEKLSHSEAIKARKKKKLRLVTNLHSDVLLMGCSSLINSFLPHPK